LELENCCDSVVASEENDVLKSQEFHIVVAVETNLMMVTIADSFSSNRGAMQLQSLLDFYVDVMTTMMKSSLNVAIESCCYYHWVNDDHWYVLHVANDEELLQDPSFFSKITLFFIIIWPAILEHKTIL
jgi:hypothetical protein